MDHEELEDRLHWLLFAARKSARYHTRRRRLFERLHRTSSFLAVIFGSAVAVSLIANLGPIYISLIALVVTVFAALDLVVGAPQSARLHHELARRFIELEQELEGQPATEELIRQATVKRLEIEADEPSQSTIEEGRSKSDEGTSEGEVTSTS